MEWNKIADSSVSMDSRQLLEQLKKFSRQRIIDSDKHHQSAHGHAHMTSKGRPSKLSKLEAEDKKKLVLIIQRLSLLESENKQLHEKIGEMESSSARLKSEDVRNVSCQNSGLPVVDRSVQAIVEQVKSFEEYKAQVRQRQDSYSILAERRQMDSFQFVPVNDTIENSILPFDTQQIDGSESSIKSTGFHKFMECILNDRSHVSSDHSLSVEVPGVNYLPIVDTPKINLNIAEPNAEKQSVALQTEVANDENLNSYNFEDSIPFMNDSFISVTASRNYRPLPQMNFKQSQATKVELPDIATVPRMTHARIQPKTRSLGMEELYKQFAKNYELFIGDDDTSLASSLPDVSSSISETETSVSPKMWLRPLIPSRYLSKQTNNTTIRQYENDERDIDIILGLFNKDVVYSANSIR